MHVLIDMSPWLIAMAVLIACSAFFSGSEAALFYLRWEDRRDAGRRRPFAARGGRSAEEPGSAVVGRVALESGHQHDLFRHLVDRGIAIGTRGWDSSQAVFFSAAALLVIIFFSEMLPKSIAVLSARRFAGLVGIPLAAAVRVLDPVMPTLRVISLLSRRLIWPQFRAGTVPGGE